MCEQQYLFVRREATKYFLSAFFASSTSLNMHMVKKERENGIKNKTMTLHIYFHEYRLDKEKTRGVLRKPIKNHLLLVEKEGLRLFFENTLDNSHDNLFIRFTRFFYHD
jgi:hypothetical protein